MSKSFNSNFDLHALAHRAMRAAGFVPDIPDEVAAEVRALPERSAEPSAAGARDLRSWLWSSIDNPESRDLDQVEWAERSPNGDIRLLVGIADVDELVAQGSAIDRHAFANTTSVYTGIEVFSMLPDQLSTDLSSLLPDVDRLAIVMDMVIAPDGTVRSTDVYRALLRNRARLDYQTVGDWLEGHAPLPDWAAAMPGLEDQLRVQDEARDRLRALRKERGALDFETIEARPVTANGRVVDLAVTHKNQARDLIESLMVAANSAMAGFLEAQGSPVIQRVVRTPERWPRIVEIAARLGDHLPEEADSRALADFLARRKSTDPPHFADLSLSVVKLLGPGQYTVLQPGAAHEGHFGLAVPDYTHSTAPNRRYVDLVAQRLLKAALLDAPPPYSNDELDAIAQHCMERENASRKVERLLRKAAAAVLLSDNVGDVFEAVVTGANPKGTWVRLISPPAEGRVERGARGLDVGDKTRVRLLSVDPERGFIDFERVG